MDQLIHQTVKHRYQIQSLLGKQTGRRTFLAIDQKTETPVVLKLLLFGPDFSWENLKLFEREAATLKAIVHPAVPKYLDFFDVETDLGQGFALVQSYIDARSLQDWADQGRVFSESELKDITIQLLEILKYLHRQQPPIVHRDLKPSNILLGDRSGNHPGTVYLVDFGSVQTFNTMGTLTVVGTYGYMPPEQFGGETVPQSDLYSLGATLLYLITRIHPAQLPRKQGELQFDIADQSSPTIQALLQKLLKSDVEERLQSAQHVLDALQDQSHLLSIHAPQFSKPEWSRISLNTNEDSLSLFLPSPARSERNKIIKSTLARILLLLLPLASFGLNINLGISISLLCGIWIIKSIWDTQRRIFSELYLSIDPQTLSYQRRKGIWGVERETISTSSITNLEKKHREYHYRLQYEVTGLYLWTREYGLPLSAGTERGNETILSSAEVDWLAAELSQWLHCPIEQSLPSNQVATPTPLATPDSKAIGPSTSQDSSDPQSIQRPDSAVCELQRSATSFSIIAPVKWTHHTPSYGYGLYFLGWLFLSAFFPIHVAFLITVSVGLFTELISAKANFHKPSKIELKLGSRYVRLLAHHHDQITLLQQQLIESVDRIQITYLIGGRSYQVSVITHNAQTQDSERLIVGDRRLRLSGEEAYWLARELRQVLNVPVEEIEVTQPQKRGNEISITRYEKIEDEKSHDP